jgi:L-threonylcarbamoyladenylate synthase
VTNHPIARDLCAQFCGPLVSTSANPTTRPSIKESRKLLKTFADSDIFIVHRKVGELKQETAIYDAVSGKRLRCFEICGYSEFASLLCGTESDKFYG